MRIITYNLRAGGSGKVHWSKVFEDFDPDVFLVQESYEPIQHLPPLIHGNRHQDARWKSVEGMKWGSAVCVKGKAARRLELPDFHGHVVGVEVDGSAFEISNGRPIRIFSVHAPDRGGYQRAVNSILDMIGANRGDGDLVVGGDFNLTVGERLEAEQFKTSKADLAILARLRDDFGLVSAWQAANAGIPLPQTLRWAKEKVTPYHCDGIFIPQQWTSRMRSCTIVSGPEWDGLSDHNPVMVEIG
jgi:exonuclease III